MGQLVSRRNALKIAAAVVAAPAAAAEPITSIASLCAEFRAAYAECDRLWSAASNIEEGRMAAPARVQIGRLVVGINDDGSNKTEPMWAYSFKKLEEHYDRECRSQVNVWAHGVPGREEEIRARYAEKLAERKADLQREFDRERDEEEASGYAQAARDASRAGDRVEELLAQVMAFPFRTLDEVRIAAACVDEYDATGMTGVNDEFVKALAGKAGAA